jgi:hypothetical protein
LGNHSLSAQLRPKEYKKIPESTLNATLEDIHDFIQYAVVQAQKVVFGQDLQKTFAAFFGLSALSWLVKTVSPFWLTVVALTSVYAAPLAASAHGRGLACEAGVRVKKLATTATENGRAVAHDASVGVQRLASAATETGRDAVHDASMGIRSLVNTTTETGRAAANSTNAGAQARVNAATEDKVLAQKDKDKAADLSGHAKGTANAKEYISSHPSNNMDKDSIKDSDRDQTGTHGAANHASDASHSQTVPSVYASQQPSVASSKPVYMGTAVTGTAAHPGIMHTTAGDEAIAHSVLERPRGAAYPA